MWTAWNCSLLIQSRRYRKFTDPAGDLCCYVLCGLETGSYVFGLYPDQPALHGHYVLCWNEAHGPYYQSAQKMNNTIIEYINGMEVVKVFNRESESYENFRKDVTNYRDYTLAWYKAAWPWMAIYGSLLPCTVILTLPLGAWFVLCGISTLPDLILVLLPFPQHWDSSPESTGLYGNDSKSEL